MKNFPFRTKLYIGFFLLICGVYIIINPVLANVYILIIGLIIVIISFLGVFTGLFDIIEKGSSLKYLDIRPDNDSNTTFQKIINFLYSYYYILFFNFLISISSIYLLYITGSLSNKPELLIGVSITIVLLIRFLAYFQNDVAKEIGKTFRYTFFPLGLALFIWDFLIPLNKKYSSPFPYLDFFIDNYATLVALVIILILITGLEPLFDLLNKLIIDYKNQNEKLSEIIASKAVKIFQKHSR